MIIVVLILKCWYKELIFFFFSIKDENSSNSPQSTWGAIKQFSEEERHMLKLTLLAQKVVIVFIKWHLTEEGASWLPFKYACAITSFTLVHLIGAQTAGNLPAGNHTYIVLENPHWSQFSTAKASRLIGLLICSGTNSFGRNSRLSYSVIWLSPTQTDFTCWQIAHTIHSDSQQKKLKLLYICIKLYKLVVVEEKCGKMWWGKNCGVVSPHQYVRTLRDSGKCCSTIHTGFQWCWYSVIEPHFPHWSFCWESFGITVPLLAGRTPKGMTRKKTLWTGAEHLHGLRSTFQV